MHPYQARTDGDRTPQPGNVASAHASHSSSSLASSFTSSAASSMLAAAPPSNSSQSDIVSSDHSVSSRSASTSSPPKNRFLPLAISPTPRSSSLAHMGQVYSRVDPVSIQPTANSLSLPLPVSTSNRLRRAWAGRRKKSEDVSSILSRVEQTNDRGQEHQRSFSTSGSDSLSSVDNLEVQNNTSNRQQSRTKHFIQSSLGVFGQKKTMQQPQCSKSIGPPPAPPPKPVELQSSKKPPTPPETVPNSPEQSSPPIVTSPGISATVQFINSNSDEVRPEVATPRATPREKSDSEVKQDWRRSDATMTSYVTIRPGALAGNRSPRPVSLAESSHSGHTIVPVNKRLSALITDAEFAMAEESDSGSEHAIARIPVSGRPSPSSSVKARNRRSASLNFGPGFAMRSKPSTPEPLRTYASEHNVPPLPRMHPTTSRDTPTLTKAAARGIISPTADASAAHSTSSNIRGRLAAWTATTSSDRNFPPPPSHPQHLRPPPHHPSPPSHPTLRQTAISMTGSLAPVAMGLGKRAAEKVHRVWGGLSSSTSSHSAYSSTSSLSGATSGSTPSSHSGKNIDRTPSGQSVNLQSSGGWKKRRTPNAPSGSWSVTSSLTSSSASSYEVPSGPTLGTRLRGPKHNNSGGSIVGGAVFGRRLQACVQETATDRVKHLLNQSAHSDDTVGVKPLEDRLLPALVVRCAQHLTLWGLQEEGLFRLSGRPTHVAKLRSEFDAGADFALAESDPGDLDPHAVASIFKAYLRELPESLLTAALIPLFESAMTLQKEENDASISAGVPRIGSNGPSLPSRPRDGTPLPMRKPPSLSTLAMPSFAGMRTMSDSTLQTLGALIAQLPQENHDLLYTVVELIQATAAHSKETKMPLGNLLLVFCPSLNMSPSLLRVLCEAKSIWEQPSEPLSHDNDPGHIPKPAALSTGGVAAPSSQSQRSNSSREETDYDSDLSDVPAARPRHGVTRGPVNTMLGVPDMWGPVMSPYRPASKSSGSGQDDTASYLSALDHTSSRTPSPANDSCHNLPALTGSSDSLATPSTMSEVSSFQAPPIVISDETQGEKASLSLTSDPEIATTADLPLPPSRRPIISAPMPFIPDSASPVSPRKSLTLLSFPSLGKSEPSSVPSTPKSWAHRAKRPSLHLLFSKRSASPLASPSLAKARANPESAPPDILHLSIPSPCALRTESSSVPPVIDTPISSSPIAIFDHSDQRVGQKDSTKPSEQGEWDSPQHLRTRTDSSASSLFSTPQQTPIADYFRGHSTSMLSVATGAEADTDSLPSKYSPVALHKSHSQSSLTPSIDIGFEDSLEGNWAQSVLLEAQAKSDAGKSRWSVKDAVKIFEGRS